MARFHYSFAVLIASTVILLATLSASNAAKDIPPPFRENPNARLNDLSRADDDLNYRLPNNTEPVHYDIQLSTNVHTGERPFQGKVEILINILEDTRTIVLHARQLSDFVATIQRENIATSYPMGAAYEQEREFLTLTPTDNNLNFRAGERWHLTITYNGMLRQDNGGFYISTYTNEKDETVYLATTQFESTDARHGFPCYDEPAKRATFTIQIKHDPSYNAISNMPVDEAKSTPGTTVFQTTVNMPSYLVAFIVSDFKFTEGELNSLPQRVYSRPGSEHDQEWALVSGMLLVQRLGEYYGIKFALPKLDQVAVPDFAAGAMENWGLVTYREEYLLYNSESSTVNTQTNIANTVAHELTHQWFGNLVAVKWWSYLWLKEGFATLFSYESTQAAYPEWGVYQQFHTDDYQRALTNDASLNSRPMTYYIQTPSSISALYDAISYSKAGSVLSMFQHALTDQVFRQGLHNYLTNMQYSAAEENDLFNAIQTAAKELNIEIPAEVPVMMGSWSRQGGYPVLTVERNYADGSINITQTAFLNDQTLSSNKMWYVPINYAVKSNPDFRDTHATDYLRNTDKSILLQAKLSNDDWLILNKQSTGYYRINYDERNWQLITQGLKEKAHKVHPRNRAQLMHDAYRFSISQRLNHEILLELLTYLENEDQYAPWSTASGVLTTFNRYLSDDNGYESFKRFVAEIVGNIYDKLGVNDIPGEQHFQKYTRSVAINLACMAGITSCLEETNNKLTDLIEKGIEIEPNLRSQIICNGLRDTTDAKFDYVYNMLLESDDQAYRRILISSLGCSQQEKQIKKFIESSIDLGNSLRAQERTTILSPAYSRGEVGLLACIDFLKANWEEYTTLTVATFGGGNPLQNDIVGMSSYVISEKQEKALLELVDLVKDTGKVDANIKTIVDANIAANFNFIKDNNNKIMNWVSQHLAGNKDDGSATLGASLMMTFIALATVILRQF